MTEIGSFQITAAESEAFARASGDFNPLHLDAVAARRTQFGSTLIHGVFGTARALDILLRKGRGPASLAKLKVKYTRPVAQGREISVRQQPEGDSTRLELYADGHRCQIIDVMFGADPVSDETSFTGSTQSKPPSCEERTIDSCAELSETVPLRWRPDILEALLPHATAQLPPSQLATLLACTEIVGMRCPGLHSVFAQLELHFHEAHDETARDLDYRVVNADARFDRVEIGIENAYAEGSIEAFFRARPAQQAAIADVATSLPADTFTGQRALVVGASRGLGEIIAKVLAAGGAELMLTYAAGKEDAERVAADIASARPAPSICKFDVLAPDCPAEILQFCASVTHIYYLASPVIEKGDNRQFNNALFNRYRAFYVTGLQQLLEAILVQRQAAEKLTLFIPSSVFLEGKVKGFAEYIAAKKEAEDYVATLHDDDNNVTVVAPRLPRLYTDQTSGVRGISQSDTLEVIATTLIEAFGNKNQRAR